MTRDPTRAAQFLLLKQTEHRMSTVCPAVTETAPTEAMEKLRREWRFRRWFRCREGPRLLRYVPADARVAGGV